MSAVTTAVTVSGEAWGRESARVTVRNEHDTTVVEFPPEFVIECRRPTGVDVANGPWYWKGSTGTPPDWVLYTQDRSAAKVYATRELAREGVSLDTLAQQVAVEGMFFIIPVGPEQPGWPLAARHEVPWPPRFRVMNRKIGDWWCVRGEGYTFEPEKAGVYTPDDVAAYPFLRECLERGGSSVIRAVGTEPAPALDPAKRRAFATALAALQLRDVDTLRNAWEDLWNRDEIDQHEAEALLRIVDVCDAALKLVGRATVEGQP